MSKLLLKDEKTNLQVTKNFNVSEMEFYDKVPSNLIEKVKQTYELTSKQSVELDEIMKNI